MNDQSAYSTANWMVFVELVPMAARAVGSETESAKRELSPYVLPASPFHTFSSDIADLAKFEGLLSPNCRRFVMISPPENQGKTRRLQIAVKPSGRPQSLLYNSVLESASHAEAV